MKTGIMSCQTQMFINCLGVFIMRGPFGQQTRRGRCPIEQRREFPYVRGGRGGGRGSPQSPRPLETLLRPQPPCSRPPARPPATPPRPYLPLESPCPPQMDGNSPLCSIGHRPLRVRCPKGRKEEGKIGRKKIDRKKER